MDVTKAVLTVVAENKERQYGEPNPSLTATYSGFVNGESATVLTHSPALSTTALATSPAGTYPITASGAISPNYNIIYRSGTLTVDKAPLTIAADNKTSPYGAILPALTATYTGFVNGESSNVLSQPIKLSTTATVKSAAGAYPIIVTGGLSANYDLLLKNGTLTITPAELTVTAENKTNMYGNALPPLTAVYRGFVNGDTTAVLVQLPALRTTATGQSPVGNYPITLQGGSSPNYTLKYQSGTLSITKAPLTITVDNKTKAPGAPLPAFTASYSGFVNGDSVASLSHPVVFVTTATASSPVGHYPIIGNGADALNYAIVFVNGTLTVTNEPQGPSFQVGALQRAADGSITLVLNTTAGAKVQLEASTDLGKWSQIGTQTSKNGQVVFKVGQVRGQQWQFYRAANLP
jgi:hypothetical protein